MTRRASRGRFLPCRIALRRECHSPTIALQRVRADLAGNGSGRRGNPMFAHCEQLLAMLTVVVAGIASAVTLNLAIRG
jgi:hypothetical protein